MVRSPSQLAHRSGLRGAYGIVLDGLPEDADQLLGAAGGNWTRYMLSAQEGAPEPVRARVGPSDALFSPPSGGTIFVDRAERLIVVTSTPRRTSVELIHPTLAHAAGIVAWWSGLESFHAGGFVVDGGTWGVVAERGGGKSSTLAQLVAAGTAITADDLIVVERSSAFAGPRALDLRGDAAARLGVGEPMGVVGLRERWRVELGDCPPVTPLRGWIVLEWGATVTSRRLGGAELLRVLGAQRAVNLPSPDPAAFLDLAALPAWSVQRPRDVETLPQVTELMLELVGG